MGLSGLGLHAAAGYVPTVHQTVSVAASDAGAHGQA